MILLQIFTVVFAIALAWSNKIAVLKMIDYGASIKEEKEFHRANAVVKILWALAWSLGHGISVQVGVYVLLLLLIQWTIFDVALNVFLKKDNILYVGETATIDKALRFGITVHIWGKKILIKGLGDYAGLVKLLVVSTAILVINFFL